MPVPTVSPLPVAPSRSDAPSVFVARADAMVAALPGMVSEINVLGEFIEDTAISAAEKLAEQEALVASAGFSGTSTSTLAIGTGDKTLAVQPNLSFVPGSTVMIAASASPTANYMTGVVKSYDRATGALVVTSQSFLGGGSLSAWIVTLSGPRGATGPVYSSALANVSSATAALVAGGRYRLTARITAGTLPASPGVGGEPIEIMSAVDAQGPFHTFTPNGAETVTVGGTAGSPLYLDVPRGTIVKLIPVAAGWEMGN